MPITLEYMLVVDPTPQLGGICILLHDNGKKVILAKPMRESDERFYRLLGAPMPRLYGADDFDNSAVKVIPADPNIQLWLGGRWDTLANLADIAYQQVIEATEASDEYLQLNASFRKLLVPGERRLDMEGITKTSERMDGLQEKLKSLRGQINAFRESLLHFGISKGMFPPEYGLH